MAILISKSSINPDTISSGVTKCTIYFYGQSFGTNNTAVNVIFTIDTDAVSPVNFCDASGTSIGKSINQTYNFTNSDTQFVKASFLVCNPPNDGINHSTPLIIEATEVSTGLTSNDRTTIFYHN